jgi:hypothetical protein
MCVGGDRQAHPPLLLADADQHDHEARDPDNADGDHGQGEQRAHNPFTSTGGVSRGTLKTKPTSDAATATAAEPGPFRRGR